MTDCTSICLDYQSLESFVDAAPCGLVELRHYGNDFIFSRVNGIATEIMCALGGPNDPIGCSLCLSVQGHLDPLETENGLSTYEIYRRIAYKEAPYESGFRDAQLEFVSPTKGTCYFKQRVIYTRPGVISIGFLDITDKVLLIKKLEKQSITHELTGLYTRSYMYHAINTAIDRYKRGEKSCYIRIDIDDFGIINKMYGHPVGDRAIIWASRLIKSCTRTNEPVGCMGGDEFATIVQGDISNGKRAAERIKDALDSIFCVNFEACHPITASIGVVEITDSTNEVIDARADTAQRQAKADGKNQVVIWGDNTKTNEKYQLEQSLLEAINNKEFILHYQPIINIETEIIHGYEALVRWKRKDGLVYPDTFIPILENLGSLHLLTRQIFLMAAERQCEFIDSAESDENVKWLSVNVSPSDLDRDDFREIVSPLISCSCSKHFEITERFHLSVKAKSEVSFLQSIGHKVALDDFGTGYSRYNELKEVDLLKIDKSLVDDIATDTTSFEVCAGIISLAKILKLSVIAEGVETTAQLAALKRMKCDYAQGYLFGKPGPI